MPTAEVSFLSEFHCDRRAVSSGGEVITVAGELDLATAPEVERALRAALLEAGTVVVDLDSVVFMDSAGVHILVDAERRARWLGCDLSIVSSSVPVQRVLELTDTAEMLPLATAGRISARG